jgi:hypothetical protein
MTIPYGGIALLSGVLALVFKAQAVGLQLLGAGAVISLCSVLSIKAWKGRSSSTPYTLVCAGAYQAIAANPAGFAAKIVGFVAQLQRGFIQLPDVPA